MSSSSVPVPPRWRTVGTERTLLAVAHNVTAATRLLDVLSLFSGDPRIQTVFTCPGSSAFTRGTEEYLSRLDIPLLPWESALRESFDWALSASYGGDLHELKAPLTVIPHGMGYNKFLKTENRKPKTENRKPVFGLSSPWLLHEGNVVAEHIALSHQEQLDRLRTSCPPAAANAVVVGDPCLDRLRAAQGLRETYRQAFGVARGQKLVFLSSTWGARSLYGSDPALPSRIASQLPLDEYRIVLALHPNVHHGHFPWQVRMWLEECRRAGVLVLSEESLWQQAVISADVTIGDHGSVTFYSACLGTPVLLATAPHDTVDPASPIAAMLRTAPLLTEGDLARQLGTTTQPVELSAVTTLASSVPGESAARLTELGYRTLCLNPPDRPPRLPTFPLPRVAASEPRAQWVTVVGDEVVRHAAAGEPGPPGGYLVVTTDEADPRMLERADIVVGGPVPDPVHWITATLRALPGCSWVSCPADSGWLAGSESGLLLRFATAGPPPSVLTVLHTHRHTDLPPAELRFRAAGRVYRATVEIVLDDRSECRGAQ